ncbi:hypothetical protein [Pseudomonas sp. EL_65y_Pfl1_R32]|uniref:hypothetical protein n=1 Tax=Pseudomonas sp. EL_65y_Pfl1_R32 TaxID=3088696 RepID=UPI0030DAA704
MSFAHIGTIEEVSDVLEANRRIESGHELLQIVPGRTDDGWPTTLFYLGKQKAKSPSQLPKGGGFQREVAPQPRYE